MNLHEDIHRIQEMMGLITESVSYLLRRVGMDRLNDEFKEKYDNLYKEFDQRKINKTLI